MFPAAQSADLVKNWEEKLLETKVANFARDPNADDDSESLADEGGSPERQADASQRPGDSSSYTSGQQPHGGQSYYSPSQYADQQRQYAGGLALPPMAYGDARVKNEPDGTIRPRGGAVRLSQVHALKPLLT